jgi:hypothetical protein
MRYLIAGLLVLAIALFMGRIERDIGFASPGRAASLH